MLYCMAAIDRDRTVNFAERLASGEDLTIGNPILILREMLLSDLSAPRRMPQRHQAELVIRAWNAYHAGDELRYLRGTLNEFPKIQ